MEFSNFIHGGDRQFEPFCGNRPSYPPIKSDSSFFRVTFTSNNKFDANGFKARYRFIEGKESVHFSFPHI